MQASLSIQPTATSTTNNVPLLLCLHCKKTISTIRLEQADSKMNICISCSCTQQDTVTNLHEYIKKLRETQIDEMPKCNEHVTSKADKYCYNCFQWLCQECIKTHYKQKDNHMLIEYAVTKKCDTHNKPFMMYCQTCNATICEKCLPTNNDHYIIPFIFQDNHSNVFDTIMCQINQAVLTLISLIDQQIEKPTNMKDVIQLAYMENTQINQDLVALYQSIWRTELTSNEKTSLLQNIKINTYEFANKELPIEEEFNRFQSFLKKYYVLKQVNVCTTTLTGHEHYVLCLLVLNDNTVAFGSYDFSIRLWNPSTNVCTATLTGHSDGVSKIVVLNDSTLASASYDKTIKLWNKTTYQCTSTLIGHTDSVYSLVVLNEGILASGSYDNTIRFWNTSTNECIAELTGHSGSIYCLLVLNDGRLASGSGDMIIKIWNTSTQICAFSLTGHTDGVSCLVELKNDRLASSSYDMTLRLWNTLTQQCITTITGHEGLVSSLVLLNDGRLASGSGDKTIKLWNASTYECIASLIGHSNDVYCLDVLNQGTLISGSLDGTVKLWDVQ